MPARYCGLFAICLCFAQVGFGAETRASPPSEPGVVVCHCRFVELSATAAAEFDATADLANPRLRQHRSRVDVPVYKNVEKALSKLRESGRARINEGLPIAAPIDKPSAALLNGGEFPILIPVGSSHQVRVKWQQFGYRYEIVPHWLDTGKLQLQVTPEIATKDMKHAVVAGGLTIPGLTTRGASARVEMHLGETAVVNLGSNPDEPADADSQTLFLVTLVAANRSSN
jgi:hypothetical protein